LNSGLKKNDQGGRFFIDINEYLMVVLNRINLKIKYTMKNLLIFMLMLFPFLGESQINFTEITDTGDIIPQFYGNMYWDGSRLLVSGYSEVTMTTTNAESKVYSVNSLGACGEETSPGVGVSRGFYLAYPGVNGKNFIEVGRDNFGSLVGIIYIANGSGGFTQQNIIALEEAHAVLFDWDNDGDLDLWYEGADAGGTNRQLRYQNNNGVMTLFSNQTSNACDRGDVEVADTDNDGDFDVLVTGWNDTMNDQDSILYRNDGSGVFTSMFNAFSGAQPDVQWSSITFLYLNNDNDIDVVVTGWKGVVEYISQSYLGNGNNTFSYLEELPVLIQDGDTVADDVDGDGDDDLYLLGFNTVTGSRVTQLYLNDGTGHLTLSGQNFDPNVHYGMFAVFDFNFDGKKDLFILGDAGNIPLSNPQAGVYANLSGCTSVTYYADVDGDGDGDPDNSISTCDGPPEGYVTNSNDTDPNDPCLPIKPIDYEGYDGSNPIWRAADCDGDGYLNGIEHDLGTRPYDPNDFPLGVEDNFIGQIGLYPNPARDIVNIDSGSTKIVSMSVYDQLGRLVLVPNDMKQFSVASLSSGLYLVQVQGSEGQVGTKKFIKI